MELEGEASTAACDADEVNVHEAADVEDGMAGDRVAARAEEQPELGHEGAGAVDREGVGISRWRYHDE